MVKIKKQILIILAFVLVLSNGLFIGDIAYGSSDDNILWLEKDYSEVSPIGEGLIRVKYNNIYGIIDDKGQEVVPIKYNYIVGYTEGLSSVYLGEKTPIYLGENRITCSPYGNKVGYIDTSGKEVIPLEYENTFACINGLISVQKNGKDGAIDRTGKEVIPFIYDSLPYFEDGLAVVSLNKKYGIIDTKGNVIIPIEYAFIWRFAGHDITVAQDLKGKYNLIDKSGNIIKELKYDYVSYFKEGLAEVRFEDQYGYIDTEGNEVIKCKYEAAGSFYDGLANVKLNGKYGFIDKADNVVIPFKYDDASYWGFWEGLRSVKLNEKYGVIDKTGKEITKFEYDYIGNFNNLNNNYALARKNGKYRYIDRNGKETKPLIYDDINYDEHINQGEKLIVVELNGKFGIVKDAEKFITGGKIKNDEAKIFAIPTASNVMVNGKEVDFESYTLNGNNYFKLRDIASELIGTKSEFDIGWNGAENTIKITTNTPYTLTEEGLPKENKPAKKLIPKLNKSLIYKDGNKVDLTCYKIKNNNYFSIRELGNLLNFKVDWDQNLNKISINTCRLSSKIDPFSKFFTLKCDPFVSNLN